MNLFFGGSIGSLMKPHFYRKISPVNILRNMIRQNVLWAASRAEVLQYDIVQRQISQFHEHNWEEQDSLFTRPTLDLYIMNKYWKLRLFPLRQIWNFITKNISEEEVADLENAKKVLENYENLYTVFEYGADLSGLMTTLETRIAHNNPSVPMTIYRKVIFQLYRPQNITQNEIEQCINICFIVRTQYTTEDFRRDGACATSILNLNFNNSSQDQQCKNCYKNNLLQFAQLTLFLFNYYNLIDNASHSKEWVRKIEEDVGHNIAYLATGFDESVRDSLVEKSELFHRFDLEKQRFFK